MSPTSTLTPGAPGSPVRRVIGTARPVRSRLILAGLLGALAIGSSVGLLATSAFLISKASLQPPILHLQVAIVMVRAFGIGRGVFRYAERLVGHDAAFRSLTDLRIAVYDRLATIAPAGSGIYRSGDLLSRLTADVDAMVDLHLRVVLPYVIALFVGTGSVLLLASFVPAAGVALALALAVGAIVVPAVSLAALRRSQERVAPATGRLAAETVTLVDGAAELVALGRTDEWLERIRSADAELTTASGRAAASAGIGAALGVVAQGLAVIACVYFGTQAVTGGSLQGVNLALVVLVPLAAYEAVQVLPAAVVILQRVRESARRIVAVVDSPDPVPDPVDAQDPDGSSLPPLPLTVRGLRAGWSPGDWLVGPVDLTLAPGTRTAIVGPSGGGKSTIAAGLTRLAPAAGEIRYGDLDMTRMTGDAVRRIIGLVQQDAHLFDTTVVENVRLANRAASDEQIRTILDELGLGDWLDSLPDGMNTRVGRLGRSVSGGQRQRIAVARILVSDFPVVVADEPTEHLDAPTAALVMAALNRHCRDRALLLITHREADTTGFDQVVRIGDEEPA